VALAKATGDKQYLEAAERALNAFSPVLSESPAAAPLMLTALEEYLDARRVPQNEGRRSPLADRTDPGAGIVTAEATIDSHAHVEPGRDVEIATRLKIKKGWHIYANGSDAGLSVPTTVALKSEQPLRLTSVDYPAGIAKKLDASGPEA